MKWYYTVQDGSTIYKFIRVNVAKPAIQLSIDMFVKNTGSTNFEMYFEPLNQAGTQNLLPAADFQDGYFQYNTAGLQVIRFAFDPGRVPAAGQVLRCRLRPPPWHNGDGRTIAINQIMIDMVD